MYVGSSFVGRLDEYFVLEYVCFLRWADARCRVPWLGGLGLGDLGEVVGGRGSCIDVGAVGDLGP